MDLMTSQEYIRSLAKEAELYRNQGLLEQSREKYLQILQFAKKKQFPNQGKLIAAVKNRVRAVEEDLVGTHQETATAEMSEASQDMIKELFSVAQTREVARLEGAEALAGFGHYERALKEFHALLKEGILPVVAAKNILRCYMELSSPDQAVAQFREWASSGDVLSAKQLRLIRIFLRNLLEEEGIKTELPPLAAASLGEQQSSEEETVLDISSVNVPLKNGPQKGDMVGFEVTCQSGNTISVNIPAEQKDLADTLVPGLRLPELQCYSSMAVFKASGIVIRRARLWHGQNQGNYLLDITINEE